MVKNVTRNFKHHLGNAIRFLHSAYLRSSGVQIGKDTMISLGAKIDVRRGRVIIGDECFVTWGSVILSHDAVRSLLGRHDCSEYTTILEDRVFISVNSVVLPGVRIGEGSVVGAGAVVSRDVPAHCLVAGNPAKIIKEGIKITPLQRR